MSLRVISGSAKGRKLRTVAGDTTRPVTDRVKEALFDILGGDVRDSSWLDLFGGTGAVGIEALSRGAGFARFIDLHRGAVQTIRWNLENCKLSERAEVIQGDAFTMLARSADRHFDYVYIAPPQYKGLWLRALQALDTNPGWLGEDAWVIIQIHPKEYHAQETTHLSPFDQRKYGSTLLVFFQRKIINGD